MIVVRFLLNLVILTVEIAAIAAVAWLGYSYPYLMGVVAAVLALGFGLLLERQRLKIEIGFYFGRGVGPLSVAASALALGEACLKAVLAGVVALVTFAGTDDARRFVVAVVFGVCVFAGSSLLRRLSISFGANPSRWGYFRLAAPLGLLYSAAIYFAAYFGLLTKPSFSAVAGQLVFDTPQTLTLERASELLFVLKQKFDDIVVTVLQTFMPQGWAELVGILVSVNMLTGFAIAVFAVAIAQVVRQMETAAG